MSLLFLASFLLLEIALRVVPQVIPISLLVDFTSDIRSRVAAGRGLPTDESTTLLLRDDGGPPRAMRVFKPHAVVRYDFDDPGLVNEVAMDANGFCNLTAPPASGASIPLVVLGDSFTWCLGVHPDETWVARLSSRLNLPAYNLGTIAIGPYEYLQLFKKFGVALSPDLVILNLYGGNDLRDALVFHEYRRLIEGGDYVSASLPREGSGSYATEIRRFLKDTPLDRHSYAYNLIYSLVRAARRRVFGSRSEDGERTLGEPPPNFRYRVQGLAREIIFNPANMDFDEVLMARKLREGEIHPDLWEASLREFVALSRRHRFTPVVTFTPSAHTAYADRVVFEDPSLPGLLDEFSRAQRQYLSRHSEEIGYSFVDLTLPMEAAARDADIEELLYFPSNLHLTREGHRVVAEALAEALRQLGYPPAAALAAQSPPIRHLSNSADRAEVWENRSGAIAGPSQPFRGERRRKSAP